MGMEELVSKEVYPAGGYRKYLIVAFDLKPEISPEVFADFSQQLVK